MIGTNVANLFIPRQQLDPFNPPIIPVISIDHDQHWGRPLNLIRASRLDWFEHHPRKDTQLYGLVLYPHDFFHLLLLGDRKSK